jgi:hypothetical protein
MENMENNDDLDFLISGFKKSTNIINKTKDNFKSFLDADYSILNELTDILVSCPESLLLSEMKKIELRTCRNQHVSRIQYILNHISKDAVKEYQDFINDKYPSSLFDVEYKEINEKFTKLDKDVKEWIKINNSNHYPKEMNDEKNRLNSIEMNLNDFYSRHNSIIKTFNELIPMDVYGDETLITDNLESVYFTFPNNEITDDKYLELFVKEIRRIQSPHTSLIKKVSFNRSEDIKVLMWFDNIQNAEKFFSTKTFIEGIYEKYNRKVSGHNFELDWGVNYK